LQLEYPGGASDNSHQEVCNTLKHSDHAKSRTGAALARDTQIYILQFQHFMRNIATITRNLRLAHQLLQPSGLYPRSFEVLLARDVQAVATAKSLSQLRRAGM